MYILTKGFFRQLSTEDYPSFVYLNGDQDLNIDVSRYPDVPLETIMEVKLEDGKLLEWKRDPSVAHDIDSNRLDIACAFVTRLGEEPSDREIEEHLGDCQGLQNEVRRLSAGRWQVDVTPYFYQSDSGFSLEYFDWQGLRRFIEEENPDNRHNYWGASGGWSTRFCGKAPVGGRYFWAYPNCGLDTKIHELFHNLGLHHAGTPGAEYGEGKVWMGNSNIRDTHNAPQMHRVGLIDDEYIKWLDRYTGSEVNLQVADTYPLAMMDHAHKIVICKTGSMQRKRVAVSYNDGTVDVHIPATEGSIVFAKTTLLASLEEEGDSYFVAGVKVTRGPEYSNGNVVKVTVTNDTDMADLVQEPTFDHLVNVYLPADPTELNGIWRNPAWDAQGVHVRYLPERGEVFVAWLTWDNNRNQEWYWSVASYDAGGLATGPLYTINEGQELEIVGDCSLCFYDSEQGIFRASLEGQGIYAVPLERLSEAIPSRYNGYWGMGDSEGLSLEAVDVSEEFDYQRAVGYYLTNDGRWSLVEGPLGEDLTIYSITGGGRGIAADVSIKATGTLSHDRIQSGIALA